MTSEANPTTEIKAQLEYESPHFDCNSLRLITLGGTPGGGDSGAPGNENPPIGRSASVDSEEGGDFW